MSNPPLEKVKRIVVKLGTGVLTSGVGVLDQDRINGICSEVAALRAKGIEVILVSSGAVGLGMGRLGLTKRPKDLASLQACAAIGQCILVNTWQQGMTPHDLNVAQILLTREDLRARSRHDAVLRTIERLLATGSIPVVNENDTVSAEEIKFGDNDTLSAQLASVSRAELLCILSTIEGLLDMKGSGKVVSHVAKITPEIEAMASGTTSPTAVGGMVSKLSAAKIAVRAGCAVIIASGRDPSIVRRLIGNSGEGTYFAPRAVPIQSKRRWLALQDRAKGQIQVDPGAERVLINSGRSLLPAGIEAIKTEFLKGDVIQISNREGKIFARGIAEQDSTTMRNAQNETKDTSQPKKRQKCAVHRDNLVLLEGKPQPSPFI